MLRCEPRLTSFHRLIDSLQASSEVCTPPSEPLLQFSLEASGPDTHNTFSLLVQTNSTRAKTLELHIAQRVAAELEKIRNRESSALEEIRKKIAAGEETTSSSDSPKSSDSLLQIQSISPKDLLSSESDEEKQRKSQTSQKVQQEIEKLKQTLGQRKVLRELPKDVESACVPITFPLLRYLGG